ncbi:uncharacterized protein LOC121055560 [Oryza brachyantha]|uniref:uncharacterized protein LOC121055560 n=1 Tax=Oryza brachyantha TaxID=4533 RepID=UPI001ADC9067|nr:uncharacterized protein LOC121055560 [Oryza brachyantha]
MEHVLVDQFTGGIDDGRRLTVVPPRRSIYGSCFTYAPARTPFQYTPYEAALYSSLSLPHMPYTYHAAAAAPCPAPGALFPHLPIPAALTKYSTLPYGPWPRAPPAATAVTKGRAVAMMRSKQVAGECKRKKPRTPRSAEEPVRAQRRRPLERAAPLPPAPAVAAALDDLEREVARGFVEDLLHALAPPPSSLPLPTFSLVRAAAAKAPPSCAV